MSGKTTINFCNYRNLCTEIFKTLNNLNPSLVMSDENLMTFKNKTLEWSTLSMYSLSK